MDVSSTIKDRKFINVSNFYWPDWPDDVREDCCDDDDELTDVVVPGSQTRRERERESLQLI